MSPRLIRLVDDETGQCLREYDATALTGHELEQWARWLECGLPANTHLEVPEPPDPTWRGAVA